MIKLNRYIVLGNYFVPKKGKSNLKNRGITKKTSRNDLSYFMRLKFGLALIFGDDLTKTLASNHFKKVLSELSFKDFIASAIILALSFAPASLVWVWSFSVK